MTAGNRRLARMSAKGVIAIEHRRLELRPMTLRTSMTIALLVISLIEPAKAQDGGKRGRARRLPGGLYQALRGAGAGGRPDQEVVHSGRCRQSVAEVPNGARRRRQAELKSRSLGRSLA